MGIAVVGRCRPSDCGKLSNHQHLEGGINYLGTPFHAYSNRKDDENKSFAVNFTFSNVFKWLVESYSFIRSNFDASLPTERSPGSNMQRFPSDRFETCL